MTNELVIPAILAATVLVAGMFAFIPVQKAATVHTTIGSNISAQDRLIIMEVEDQTGGLANLPIIPAGGTITGTAFVTSAGATCVLEDTTGPTTIANPVGGNTARVAIDNTANTPPGFGANEGLQLDVPATATCQVQIFLDNQTG